MTLSSTAAPYKGHRFPQEIISHAVWLYHRFNLSFRDVEELLAERWIVVTYETVRQWCLKFGQQYASQLRRRRAKTEDKWHLDGMRLVGGGGDGAIYVFDAYDGRLRIRLGHHSGTVMCVAWSPDGRRIASGGGGRTGGELFVWDLDTGERVRVLLPHAGIVSAVAWSPDGEVVVSGCNGVLRWWSIAGGVSVREQAAHEGVVHALKLSPDGQQIASCGDDGAIKVWNIHTGAQLETLRRDRPYERMVIDGITGITDAQRASLLALGAVERRLK